MNVLKSVVYVHVFVCVLYEYVLLVVIKSNNIKYNYYFKSIWNFNQGYPCSSSPFSSHFVVSSGCKKIRGCKIVNMFLSRYFYELWNPMIILVDVSFYGLMWINCKVLFQYIQKRPPGRLRRLNKTYGCKQYTCWMKYNVKKIKSTVMCGTLFSF